MADRDLERVVRESGIALEICTAGILRTALLTISLAQARDAFDRGRNALRLSSKVAAGKVFFAVAAPPNRVNFDRQLYSQSLQLGNKLPCSG
jgi:hypothetical protein